MTKTAHKKLKIGFSLSLSQGGPSIFVSRLRQSIRHQGLAHVSSFMNPLANINLYANKARNPWKKPYVFRVDGIYFDKSETAGRNEEQNRLIFEGIEGACGIIMQSQFDYALVTKFHKKIEKPLCVINNGVDCTIFTPTGANKRKELGIKDADLVFISSAKWRAHKRLGDVIRVFLEYDKNSNKACHLLILGKGGDLVTTDHPRIHNIGFVLPRDLPCWYRTGDVFLFFSWLDHCPNTVAEAIACGLPVVCTNQGGTRELIEITKGGIIAEADADFTWEPVALYTPPQPNFEKIMIAINQMISNYDTYVRNIEREMIDIDNVAQRYVAFIDNVYRGL